MATIGREKLLAYLRQGYRIQEANWGGIRYSLYRPKGTRADIYPYYPIRIDTARRLIKEGVVVKLPREEGQHYMGELYGLAGD